MRPARYSCRKLKCTAFARLVRVRIDVVGLEKIIVHVPHGENHSPIIVVLAQALDDNLDLVHVPRVTPPIAVCTVEVAVLLSEPLSEALHEDVEEPGVAPSRQHPQALEQVEERIGVARRVEQHALRRDARDRHHGMRCHEHVAGAAALRLADGHD
jgi:hypothetical protein